MEPSPTLRISPHSTLSTQGDSDNCLGWEQGPSPLGPKEECDLEARVKGLSKEPPKEGLLLTSHSESGGVDQGSHTLKVVSYIPPDILPHNPPNISPKIPLPIPRYNLQS